MTSVNKIKNIFHRVATSQSHTIHTIVLDMNNNNINIETAQGKKQL